MNDANPTPEIPLTTPFNPDPPEAEAPPAEKEEPAPKPADPEPAPAEDEEEEEVDDYSDLFDDEEEDDEPEEPESKPAEKSQADADEELDFSDPAVVKAIYDKQQALERKLAEREAIERRSAIESRVGQVGDEIDAVTKKYTLDKPEIKQVLKFVRARGLEPNIFSGKLTFEQAAVWAIPSLAGRAKAPTPPAARPAEGAPPKAPPAQKPSAPSNGAPSSTFDEATAAARREGWVGKLTKR